MSTPLDLTPMAAPPPPARGRRALLVALVVLLFVVLGGGIAGYIVAGPQLCALTEPERHDLPCAIPLPDGAHYEGPGRSLPPPTGFTHSSWEFTVTGTDASSLTALYLKRLPTSEWTCVVSVGVPDLVFVIAKRNDTQLVVTGTPLAANGPPTTTDLTISLVTVPSSTDIPCLKGPP